MKYSLMLLFVFYLFIPLQGQSNSLEQYIRAGLKNNLALKQRDFSLQKSLAALDEARGMFFPSIDISARYSRAKGGRTIEFPVGDLLNPVYSGLNQLMGQNIYPVINNEEINFLREKEHDTKISLVQPIFIPQLYFNFKLRSDLVEIEKAGRRLYARQLISEIRKAYFNYLKSLKALEVFVETEQLLIENLRVSRSLYENSRVTKDVVYRAEAELSGIEGQKSEAEKNKLLAGNYFNFLLNKPLDEPIEVEEYISNDTDFSASLEEVINSALKGREEFLQISGSIEVADNRINISNSNYLPSLVFAADYGFQGEEYKFTKDYDYWMASLVLSWNLFNGFKDKAKAQQSEFEKQRLETQYIELQKKIVLQVTDAYKELHITKQKLNTSYKREKSSKAAFDIIRKKFEEGLASQIEFLDARTSLTQSSINSIITEYELQIKETELRNLGVMDEWEEYLNIDSKEIDHD